MVTKYERDISVFLSFYRFFAFGLAVILTQVVPLHSTTGPPLRIYILLAALGFYTLLKVRGPLRAWRQDAWAYPFLAIDTVVCVAVLLSTRGLDSAYLLYSLAPVITAALMFAERVSLVTATAISAPVILAQLTPLWWKDSPYVWIIEGNRLLWMILYVMSGFLAATIVYRTNLNVHRRIEAGATEEERKRLRRELHDGLAQSLAFLQTKMERAERLVKEGRTLETAAALEEARSVTQNTYLEVRDSLDQLQMEPGSLVQLLREYASGFGERNQIAMSVVTPSEEPRLAPSARFHLLRITQEALSNIRAHSKATSASVELALTRGTIDLTICDNGVGFLVNNLEAEAEATGHHGLRIMRERTESLRGMLTVSSKPSQGTTIRVSVPRR